MENTLENKARFFAQYWGQKIMIDPTIDKRTFPVTSANIEYEISDPYLELTPLSDITDEDAMNVYNLVYMSEFKAKYKIREIKKVFIKNFEEEFIDFSPRDFLIIFDYLRSKGYALPWMGLSVEQQIEFGWVKLK